MSEVQEEARAPRSEVEAVPVHIATVQIQRWGKWELDHSDGGGTRAAAAAQVRRGAFPAGGTHRVANGCPPTSCIRMTSTGRGKGSRTASRRHTSCGSTRCGAR